MYIMYNTNKSCIRATEPSNGRVFGLSTCYCRMENRKINNKNIKINRAIYDKSSVIFFFFRMDSLKNSLAFADILFFKYSFKANTF